jgi:hypothetical protein
VNIEPTINPLGPKVIDREKLLAFAGCMAFKDDDAVAIQRRMRD